MNDANPETFAGGCTCGHIRYRMKRAPIVVHCCHCRFCQKMSGSTFGVNAMIEADQLVLTGEGSPSVTHTPSALPAGQRVHRCPECLLALWTNHSLLGDAIVLVNVGTLDAGENLAPDVHCFTASKHPWVVIPPDMPAFDQDYDASVVWSAQAQARLDAVFGQ